jgi:hypothetical protein
MLSDIPSFKISSKLMKGWKKSVIAQKSKGLFNGMEILNSKHKIQNDTPSPSSSPLWGEGVVRGF